MRESTQELIDRLNRRTLIITTISFTISVIALLINLGIIVVKIGR